MTDDLEQTTITPKETYEPAPDAAPASQYEPAAEYEPAADAAPATTVLAPGATASGNRRWAIAAGVVGVLVVASALAFSAFTGRAANAAVLGYVPSDSIMYGEFRMDLPGDQRQAVGSFLSKFPGFADQSTIETKIDEVLDRIVGGATDGEQAFSSDIKPWFGGEVAFSVGALPDPATLESPDASMDTARFLALLSVKDEAAATAWFESAIAGSESGSERSTETYNGATIHVFNGPNPSSGAFAVIDGRVAVLGDPTSVRAAVDTKGGGTFADGAEFRAALDATTGDHIGFMYIALRPLMEWSTQVGGEQIQGLDSPALAGLVPDWTGFALRVEGDALRMETLAPKPEAETPSSRTSTVAEHVPSSAIALSVSNDYGKGILSTIDTYRDEPSLKEVIDGFDQAIGVLGGPEAALGWVGDFGIAVTRTDGGVEGGLVITPTDAAAARNLFTSLRTIVSLGGGEMGITLREEDHAGTTITIVDLGELSDLAGLAGMAGGVSPEMLGTDLPAGHIELAYAITDEVVVLGSGPGFVRSVLDTTPDTSLARNDRYEALISRVGQGAGSGFVDITAIREMLERAVANADAAERAEYETNIKPFLMPIDALIGSSSITGDISRSTVIVTVR